jgi:RNA polymerase sigma-70 factor, ECF subfamily
VTRAKVMGGAGGGDQDVVAALLRGDEQAFAGLVERLHPRIVRLCRRFVASDAAAEDVAQDTWQGVLEGLAGFAGRSSLDTWILQIAINRARSRGVRDARVSVQPLGDDGGGGSGLEGRFRWYGGWKQPPRPSLADGSPETAAANNELLRLLAAALDHLPEQQRLVVILRDIELLTAPEVCAVLAVSEENQRVLLHRGRARLRAAIEVAAEAPAAAAAAVTDPRAG